MLLLADAHLGLPQVLRTSGLVDQVRRLNFVELLGHLEEPGDGDEVKSC